MTEVVSRESESEYEQPILEKKHFRKQKKRRVRYAFIISNPPKRKVKPECKIGLLIEKSNILSQNQ
jgi:hypothetical protein